MGRAVLLSNPLPIMTTPIAKNAGALTKTATLRGMLDFPLGLANRSGSSDLAIDICKVLSVSNELS